MNKLAGIFGIAIITLGLAETPQKPSLESQPPLFQETENTIATDGDDVPIDRRDRPNTILAFTDGDDVPIDRRERPTV
ncbi:hypothetical protein SAMN04487911_1243 [Arenibacter nanhaiticus]|uniref:Uncharacterized protein n=1 Tax=Arenibacter nanhaiticus TaxID=558155 RepID=A0A1M6K0E5_9FLAO|nr:hypothetical protein [Arenibacter nanhaiticus]SHJ52425.1 hypothetical protein SAMN04487911_1243 [Arenibacter nanhaiticus]